MYDSVVEPVDSFSLAQPVPYRGTHYKCQIRFQPCMLRNRVLSLHRSVDRIWRYLQWLPSHRHHMHDKPQIGCLLCMKRSHESLPRRSVDM